MRRLSVVAAAVIGMALVLVRPMSARADGPGSGVYCPPIGPCIVQTGHGGSGGGVPVGGAPGPGGGPGCHDQSGASVPCQDPVLGWFNPTDFCYWHSATPPWPTRSEAQQLGLPYHPPGDGDYYLVTCPGVGGTGGSVQWAPAPPAGYGGAVNPQVLAVRAVNLLGLTGPDIALSPNVAREQIVGLPTWMWTQATPTTWGRHTATAAVPGASVTAVATATEISWQMGDGTTVVCVGPGTPWSTRYDAHAASPTCGHTYTTASTARTITATTTWQVRWTGSGLASGVGGAVTVTRSSSVTVRVAELQAINR